MVENEQQHKKQLMGVSFFCKEGRKEGKPLQILQQQQQQSKNNDKDTHVSSPGQQTTHNTEKTHTHKKIIGDDI
jgi:hypothetical protein